jgi:DNA-binding response OmpR family regulator
MVPRRDSPTKLEAFPLSADTAELARGRRVLLVDDGPGAGYQLCGLLTALGWEVDCAEERAEAEALLLHRPYDAVVVDLRVSPIGSADGLALLSFLRSQRPRVRAVMLVDGDSRVVEAEIWRLGATALLPRPQSLSALHRLLCDLVSPAP